MAMWPFTRERPQRPSRDCDRCGAVAAWRWNKHNRAWFCGACAAGAARKDSDPLRDLYLKNRIDTFSFDHWFGMGLADILKQAKGTVEARVLDDDLFEVFLALK